ncbi:MAG: hypothetical protein QF569_01315, partial [Candidatus Poribacteria bacterium]|nr:hypothetical protein [Candidatus Poribacteria bacterium]
SYDLTINLTFETMVGHPNVFEISSILNIDAELKNQTYNLVQLLIDSLQLSLGDGMAAVPAESPARFDVGLNWRVETEWKTKELSKEKWWEVKEQLGNQFTVSWQPAEDGLEDYVAWVGACRLLVSTVGLGCHLAMLFGRRLLMLSGPTDFSEIHTYPMGKVLYPPNDCAVRPCYRKIGDERCDCMLHFQAGDIACEIRSLMEREIFHQNIL